MKTRLSFKWWAVITWILAFVVPEVAGIGFGDIIQASNASIEYVLISEWTVMTVGTFGFIYLISRYTGIGIADAVYKPPGTKRSIYVILLALLVIIPLSYFSNSSSFPLLSAKYFVENNAVLAFPFEVVYYFSEIVVVTYMYIMANKGWEWRKGVLTSGTIFVIVGWALLHVITQSALVAIIAVLTVILFYVSYEYSKSPIVPIILWFAFLI